MAWLLLYLLLGTIIVACVCVCVWYKNQAPSYGIEWIYENTIAGSYKFDFRMYNSFGRRSELVKFIWKQKTIESSFELFWWRKVCGEPNEVFILINTFWVVGRRLFRPLVLR